MSSPPAEPADFEHTLARPAAISGVGLMSGSEANVAILPADVHTGIVFVRTDLPDAPAIPIAECAPVSDLTRSTAVEANGVCVQTVEHVLSALGGLGVDNARIEIDGSEMPIGDGSASVYVEAIRTAGLVAQNATRNYLEVSEPIYVERDDRQVICLPAEHLRISCVFDRWERKGVENQVATFDVTPDVYAREIAPARTFCFEDEVEALVSAGIGLGATDDNVIVVTPHGPKANAYRFPDELVRHKVLDLIGDLFLVGMPLKAHIVALRSQHALSIELVERLRALAREERRLAAARVDPPLGPVEIEGILPHRPPLLLIDRVVELEEGQRAVAIKNVTYNEDFFRGHFPGHPVMPAVFITEALAQTGGVLLMRQEEFRGRPAYFMTIESAKFRRPVVPGDTLRLEVEVLRLRRKVGRLRGVASVDGTLVAEATLTFAIMAE